MIFILLIFLLIEFKNSAKKTFAIMIHQFHLYDEHILDFHLISVRICMVYLLTKCLIRLSHSVVLLSFLLLLLFSLGSREFCTIRTYTIGI